MTGYIVLFCFLPEMIMQQIGGIQEIFLNFHIETSNMEYSLHLCPCSSVKNVADNWFGDSVTAALSSGT